MADPQWAPHAVSSDGANNAIHGPLALAGPNAGELFAFTWQQLQQIVAGFVNEFLRQVAVALGAIDIFGFKPYQALVEIGEEIATAKANFDAIIGGLAVGDIGGLIAFLSGLNSLIQQFTTSWQSALALVGIPTPEQFVRSLKGLIPAALPQPSGGFVPNAIAGFVDNLDGTWQYIASEAQNEVAHLVQQADGTIVNAAHLVQQAHAAANAAGVAIGQAVSSGQHVTDALVNAAAGVVADAEAAVGAGVQAAQQAAANLFAGPAQFLQGLSGTFGQHATNQAYAATAAAAAAQAAQLTATNAALAAVFNVNPVTAGNVIVTVDYSAMADAATMAGVMLPGNTNMGITAGAAVRQVTTAGTDKEVFPTVTTSNYQVAQVTLGALNDKSTTEINCRSNSARDTSVAVTINAGLGGLFNVSLGCYVSNSYTLFTYASLALSSGGVVKVVVGDQSSLSDYAMQVLYNGTPIITYTDAAHVSQLGAAYRYIGLKMTGLGSGTKPPAIRTVTYQDNPPPSGAFPFSGRPTASTQGRFYFPDDCGRIDLDTGSAWRNVWAGPLCQLTPPPSSGWLTTTMGSSSAGASLDGRLITAVSAAGTNIRGEYRTLTPASNFTATFYLESAAKPATNDWQGGIILRESGSGKIIMFYIGYTTTTSLFSFAGITTYNNETTPVANLFLGQVYTLPYGLFPNWLRIRDDGSIRYYEGSLNGVDWITYYSEARTTFITANQIGYAMINTTGANATIRLRSLAGIS